jgi:hypothetical protein
MAMDLELPWWPGGHFFRKRAMALLLMVEHLSEVSHINHLPTGRARIKMVSFVFRLSVHSITDNLTGFDHANLV